MLSKKENEVMKAVYTLCADRGTCLVSPWEIINLLPPKSGYNEEKLYRVLKALQLDDYFEMISSERKGERMYVITLHQSGKAYPRGSIQVRRSIMFKVALSLGGAVLAFIAGLILRTIFNVK